MGVVAVPRLEVVVGSEWALEKATTEERIITKMENVVHFVNVVPLVLVCKQRRLSGNIAPFDTSISMMKMLSRK